MSLAKFLYPLAAILCLTPWISSAYGLLMGVVLALTIENPYQLWSQKWTSKLLSYAIIGLGAGMNLETVGRAGAQGFGFTLIGIVMAFALGALLGRLLKTEKETTLLVTVGTAICGGSAIAAVSSVIRAKPQAMSVSLGIVFTLNAVALFIFPIIGHYFSLTEAQFGLWSALAIHDTSSVVGATLQYGAQAVEIGTTVKLARALWIVPVALVISWFRFRQRQQGESLTQESGKIKKPWFILGFLLMAGLVTYVPAAEFLKGVVPLAQRLMVLTLFLIGSNLSRETLRSVGLKPFLQGLILWIVTASVSLFAIRSGWA